MAAPGALVLFNAFKKYLGDGTADMDTNNFVATLHTSAFTPNASTMAIATDLTNELVTANGYTVGGFAFTSPTYTQTAGTAAFKTGNNPTWTASGAGMVSGTSLPRYLVIRMNGTYNSLVNPLVGYMLLDSAPADVAVAAGNTLLVTMNAAGWFTNT